MHPLTRAKRAANRRAIAAQEYRDSIVAARDAGHSTREIAKAVGTSHVSVVRLLQRN